MPGFDRRLIEQFDWLLLGLSLALAGVGLLAVYSATYTGPDQPSPIVIRQLVWVGVGLGGMGVAFAVNYRSLERWAYVIYAAALVLLLLVPVLGSMSGGVRRWIQFGGFSLQPAEFVKIGLILVLARLYHRTEPPAGYRIRDILLPGAFVAVPAGLILLQPNLGTAVTLGLLFLSVTFAAGIRLRALAVLGVVGSSALPFVWAYMKPYQQRRVLSFLQPDLDPLGAGYHIIQSKVAVGSGMVWGKGFLLGTQTRLDFLPEKHTDFIFAVLAEEWGFVGAVALLALYGGLLVRLLVVAANARERFGLLLTVGVVGIVFWQLVINLGMNVGLLPVVGVPLPLLSYGGSSLVTVMLGLGLALNVSTRRLLHGGGSTRLRRSL